MIFSKISHIDPAKESTYKNRIFLTFDLDWAPDYILEDLYNMIIKAGVQAVFMITHRTVLLEEFGKNENIELGVHPNFNFLLEGDFRYGKNYREVVDYYSRFVPEARIVRSHSLTQNTSIIKYFIEKGYRYELNTMVPYNTCTTMKPFFYLDEIIKVPHFFEDDINCLITDDWRIDELICSKGIKVFNFHPVHVYLNTESLRRYRSAKDYAANKKEFDRYRNTQYFGIRDFFKKLLTISGN